MNKLFLTLILIGSLISCQLDDIKNTYTISGKVQSRSGHEFNTVIVHLLKGDQIITSSTGSQFTFPNLEEGIAYTVLPQVTEVNGRNGLSTFDMVAIENHIAGILELDLSQKTSADVNKDNVINQEDIEIVRNCIISSTDCPEYRFVSEAHNDVSFQYVDQYETEKLFADHEVFFVPIKLGDVNGTLFP